MQIVPHDSIAMPKVAIAPQVPLSHPSTQSNKWVRPGAAGTTPGAPVPPGSAPPTAPATAPNSTSSNSNALTTNGSSAAGVTGVALSATASGSPGGGVGGGGVGTNAQAQALPLLARTPSNPLPPSPSGPSPRMTPRSKGKSLQWRRETGPPATQEPAS